MEKEKLILFQKEEENKANLEYQKFRAIMTHLNYEFSVYKYTVYRCASKVFSLQKVFFTSSIPFKLVIQILENHHLSQADDDLPIRPSQLTIIIRDIYYGSEKLGLINDTKSYNLETATGILRNFFWNIFDKNQKGYITLLEVKETFLLLCEVSCLEKMITAYFLLIADNNRCIPKYRFECMMKVLTKILTFIEEFEAYGQQNISDVIAQCYEHCPGINGINEYQFHCLWTTKETTFLIYANLLALIKRIKNTEKLIHNVACASCHIEQIIGIRFKCQSCKHLSLCLKCFSIGYSNNKHRSGRHRMFEVFTDDLPDIKWTHYLAKLCNVFLIGKSGSDESKELTCDDYDGGGGGGGGGTYNTLNENNTEMITIDTKLSGNTTELSQKTTEQSIKLSGKNDLSFGSTGSNSFTEKLHNIVQQLIKGNETIFHHKKEIKDTKTVEFLNDHQKLLIEVIDQLKTLMENTKNISYPVSSTPNRLSVGTRPRLDSSQLSRSINGADLNKSYLEANKSDYSVADLSVWFHQRRYSGNLPQTKNLSIVKEYNETTENDMRNFRDLLNKVKEIVDDSYSDNSELAYATQNLESVLDGIIRNEEIIRCSK